jgi:hypothetical protein
MFTTYVHMSSAVYLHSMRDEQKTQGKAQPAQWHFWLASGNGTKKARQSQSPKHRRNDINLRPPRPALGAK